MDKRLERELILEKLSSYLNCQIPRLTNLIREEEESLSSLIKKLNKHKKELKQITRNRIQLEDRLKEL